MIREDCYWHSEEPDMGARLHMCGMQKGIAPLESCDGCESYHSIRKRTNADRIRAMTDEELAEFITGAAYDFVERPGMCDVCDTATVQHCENCWLDWLKQEATNNERI